MIQKFCIITDDITTYTMFQVPHEFPIMAWLGIILKRVIVNLITHTEDS